MKAYKNLMKKYNITEDQINLTIDEICKHGVGGSCCDAYWLCAVIDLMCNGDIPADDNTEVGEENGTNN